MNSSQIEEFSAAVISLIAIVSIIVTVTAFIAYFLRESTDGAMLVLAFSIPIAFISSLWVWKDRKCRSWFVAWLTLPFRLGY